MTSYSMVEHLAKSLWFSRWQEGRFAVFSAYFDASGHETDVRTTHVTVAGFIASADSWMQFEKDWIDCLTKYEIFNNHGKPEFHMSDCANYTYHFEGWRCIEGIRQSLLRELIEIIKPCGRKISCVVNIDEYKNSLDRELRDKFDFNAAYVLGGRACAGRVNEMCRIDKSPQICNVQFFFEDGDGAGIQTSLRERFLGDAFPKPLFKPKRDRYSRAGELIERGLVPFQAADVVAYITNLNAKSPDIGSWREKENIRWMQDELATMREQTCDFTDDIMRSFNTWMRVNTHSLGAPNRALLGAEPS